MMASALSLPPPRNRDLPRLRTLVLRKSGRPDLRWARAGWGVATADVAVGRGANHAHHPCGTPLPQGGREKNAARPFGLLIVAVVAPACRRAPE
jgi:hypothetical protein